MFVPPSPPERKSFWTTSSSRSTTSSTHRSVFNEHEPFNISRESFDSYRRSFDISARSPVIQPEGKGRASLDSRTFMPPPPRQSNSFHRPLQVPGTQTEEEADGGLEDVALDDPKPQPQKKRGMFSRIMDSDSHAERPSSQDGGKSAWHHFGGRKRGQSGSGAELGAIPKREDTPKPESQLRKEECSKTESVTKKDKRQSTNALPIPQVALQAAPAIAVTPQPAIISQQQSAKQSPSQAPMQNQPQGAIQSQPQASVQIQPQAPLEAAPQATPGAENTQTPAVNVSS